MDHAQIYLNDYDTRTGATDENVVQNYLNIALLNIFY